MRLAGRADGVDVDAVRAACKQHKKGPSPKTVAAVERALGIKAAPWRCETDPATGRTVFTNGLERRDSWPKPPTPPPSPPSPPLVDPDGFVIPSMEQVEKWQGEWEEECACQGINPWDA